MAVAKVNNKRVTRDVGQEEDVEVPTGSVCGSSAVSKPCVVSWATREFARLKK